MRSQLQAPPSAATPTRKQFGSLGDLGGGRPPTLREHAVEVIRKAIITGALRPGERIREEELAEQLGFSRGPVREAVRALEQEGLIRTEPHRASYVMTVSEEEIEEVYRVRAEVEAGAARRVALAIGTDPRLIGPYQDLLDQMRSAAAANALAELTVADLDFHRLLMEQSAYVLLPRLWSTMYGIVRAQTSIVLTEQSDSGIVVYTAESHAPIVTALAGGDPDQAADAVRHHILETRTLWVSTRGSRAASRKSEACLVPGSDGTR